MAEQSNKPNSPSKDNDESGEQASFQFGILHLAYLVSLIASGLVLLGFWSLFLTALVLGIWITINRITENRIDVIVAIAFCIVAFFLLSPIIFGVVVTRATYSRTLCQNDMRQFILALHNYASSHEKFPPAVSLDKDGNPMHSWRVRILPFIEGQAVYDQYDFSEPWNGPNNSKLADLMPTYFKCPSCKTDGNVTTYKLVCGENAFFHEDREPTISSCKDGTANALILVEDHENPVHWMKPEDISTEQAIRAILNQKPPCHGKRDTVFETSFFESNIGFLEGSAFPFRSDSDPNLIRQMINVNDGKGPEQALIAGHRTVIKPQGYIALAIYVCLLLFPGWLIFWSK